MGNNSLRGDMAAMPNLQRDYQQILGPFGQVLLKNRYTGQKVQSFDMLLDSKSQYDREILVYQFRHNNPYLVSTFFLEDNTIEDICSTNYQITLYIEHIPLRLSNIKDIPYPDSLHLIQTCLKGFNLLFEKAGYFRVEEDLIGINSFGEAKVWINSHFEKSIPETEPCQYIGTQPDIVLRIIGLVQRNTDSSSTKLTFPEFYRATPCHHTFRQAIARFYQYVLFTKQEVPSYMECTITILRPSQNIKSPFVGSNTHNKKQAQIMIPHVEPKFVQQPLTITSYAHLTNSSHPILNQTSNTQNTFFPNPIMITDSSKIKATPQFQMIPSPERFTKIVQSRQNVNTQLPLQQRPQHFHKNQANQRMPPTHLNRFENGQIISYKSVSPKINPVFLFKSDHPIQPQSQSIFPISQKAMPFLPSNSPMPLTMISQSFHPKQSFPILGIQPTIQRPPPVLIPLSTQIVSKTQNILHIHQQLARPNIQQVPKYQQMRRPSIGSHIVSSVQNVKVQKKNDIFPKLIPLFDEVASETSQFSNHMPHYELPKQTQQYKMHHNPSNLQFKSSRLKSRTLPTVYYSSQSLQANQPRISAGYMIHQKVSELSQSTKDVEQPQKKTIQTICQQLNQPITQVYIECQPKNITSFFPRYNATYQSSR